MGLEFLGSIFKNVRFIGKTIPNSRRGRCQDGARVGGRVKLATRSARAPDKYVTLFGKIYRYFLPKIKHIKVISR